MDVGLGVTPGVAVGARVGVTVCRGCWVTVAIGDCADVGGGEGLVAVAVAIGVRVDVEVGTGLSVALGLAQPTASHRPTARRHKRMKRRRSTRLEGEGITRAFGLGTLKDVCCHGHVLQGHPLGLKQGDVVGAGAPR